ncbi:MAG: hypothetical protein M3M96_03360 [Candidatus Eremiobacteraeota bacterium]|nr:hypothetical protein [Candidatus Eremiobacteraeota bacterium]
MVKTMNDRAEANTPSRGSQIEDWMIYLLEDDRPATFGVTSRLTDGLGWMYVASFVRNN